MCAENTVRQAVFSARKQPSAFQQRFRSLNDEARSYSQHLRAIERSGAKKGACCKSSASVWRVPLARQGKVAVQDLTQVEWEQSLNFFTQENVWH